MMSFFFFEDDDGDAIPVNEERYRNMISTFFIPQLRRRTRSTRKEWFQQDGATPHTARATLNLLEKTFAERVILMKTDFKWPPHSPDLNPLDFFLWGFFKDRVYRSKPVTLDELKVNIRREISLIDEDILQNVVRNFECRVDAVQQMEGKHVEHVNIHVNM